MPILDPGAPAPDFEREAVDGSRIRLSDYRGTPVLLSFFRYVTCPVCNLRVQQLAQNHERFSSRIQVIAVFESPNDAIQEYVEHRGLPFPLIGDPEGELYDAYGVDLSWIGMILGMLRIPTVARAVRAKDYRFTWSGGHAHRVPADFLIDRSGYIMESHYGRWLDDHMPFAHLEHMAKQLAPA